MPLGFSEDANVTQLMEWLRSSDAPSDAVQLREELAYLLFYGDPTWANYDDSVSDYRGILAEWFADDSSSESQFIELTKPGNESENARADLVTWFTPLVERWKQEAKDTEGNVEKGLPNPRYETDSTPGTQFYYYDSYNEVYLYASTPDAPDHDWLSYEDRRYTEVAYDDVRQTSYRQDVVTNEHEYLSRARSGIWLTEAEWDQEVADSGGEADTNEPQYTAPVYDATFEMYRRFNSVRLEYEYAEDPADAIWLSVAEANARADSREQAEQEQDSELAAQGPADIDAEQDPAERQAQDAAGRVAGDAASQIGLVALRELAAQGGIDLAGVPAGELVTLIADVVARSLASAELAG